MPKTCISKKECSKITSTLGFASHQGKLVNSVCVVKGTRCLGKVKFTPTHSRILSPLVNGLVFSVERNNKGKVLALGQIPVLQSELKELNHNLIKQGLRISSIHNSWIWTSPSVLYVNIYLDNCSPYDFACRVKKALKDSYSCKLKKSIYDTLLKSKCKKVKCSSSSCSSSSSSSSCSSSSSSSEDCSSSSSEDCSSSSSSSSSEDCSSSSSSSSSSSDCSSSSSSSSSSDCSSSSSSSDCSSSSSSSDCSSDYSSSSCSTSEYYY